ncbi:MAG TPA: lysophospholipid acyltransferase family protein [Verrucomicrobiae bacterium]|nr:lysophospholipid acyltransferase family protein [Verrucomicrobiae bacterium]
MIGWFLRVMVSLIGGTLRWRVEDPAGLLRDTPQRSCIFAFWHNRIFLLPYLFRKHWHSRQRDRVAVLVSASKDGEFLTGVLDKFNLICVRGSSSRRGKQALREMTELVNLGYDAGITPDGPRGPKYVCQSGVISLAQLTQAPIIPVSWDVNWKWTVKSWDGFMVPLPFGRATLRIGAPMTVAAGLSDEEFEAKRLELEKALRAMGGN